MAIEKKFRVLRIIGTIWKIMAWIALIVGVLSAIGILLTSILGGGIMQEFGRQYGDAPWTSWAFGLAVRGRRTRLPAAVHRGEHPSDGAVDPGAIGTRGLRRPALVLPSPTQPRALGPTRPAAEI
jgi:hypothetical protein